MPLFVDAEKKLLSVLVTSVRRVMELAASVVKGRVRPRDMRTAMLKLDTRVQVTKEFLRDSAQEV